MRRKTSCLAGASRGLADGASEEGRTEDASGSGAGARVEANDLLSRDSTRRELFKVDGLELNRLCRSGFVEADTKSVRGESTTAAGVILIIEVETDSGDVPAARLTGDGSKVTADAVKVGIERLRRARTVDTTVMRRSKLAAAAAFHRPLG